MRRLSFAYILLLSILFIYACGNAHRGVPHGTGLTVGAGSGAGEPSGGSVVLQGSGGAETCIEDDYCGNEIHSISFDVPNVYFVFDRSGSMEELSATENKTRYKVVRDAAIEMISSLGPLINVGAAIFPYGQISVNPCTDGDQVFPVTPGDPITGQDGPTTLAFRSATNWEPKGGTPIAATMDRLYPIFESLSGRTLVLLLTDGGPNCNEQAECEAEDCMAYLEGFCPVTINCCAEFDPQFGPTFCVDRPATVTAIDAIYQLGVEVYVIGITGSEYYAGVLDEMAEAGGTAQEGELTKYHRVDDLTQLGVLFSEIAADAISCEFVLTDPPAEEGDTNVYLGCDVLPYDPVHGWDWKSADTVELHGAACLKLKSGQVSQVQIVTGCPTELPK